MNGTGERLVEGRRHVCCWRARSRARRRDESEDEQVTSAVEGQAVSATCNSLIAQRLYGSDLCKRQQYLQAPAIKTNVNGRSKSQARNGISQMLNQTDDHNESSPSSERRPRGSSSSSLQKNLGLIHLIGLFLLLTTSVSGLGESSRPSATKPEPQGRQLQLLRRANLDLARRSDRLQRDTSPTPEGSSQVQAPTCGYPGSPAHASVTFNTSHVVAGTAAAYTCDNGYELLGPPRRICQANGTWSPVGIPFCVLNVGLGKAAMQSSTAGHGSAQKAVDGSTSPYFQASTCTMTDVEHNPWWYVNLLEPYLVQIVRIDFGTACCANRQKATIAVRVGNNRPDLGNNPLCNRYNGFIEEGKPLFLPCTRPAPGAFVSIHLESPSGSSLSICETFIYTDHALSIEQCPSFRDQPLGSTATYNGKCYLFHNNQALSFDGAQKYCESRGGTLVDETSPALQGFLSWELYRRHRNDQLMGQYWLGAVRDARNSHNWKWISGKDVQISFWSSLTAPAGNCSRFDGSKGWLWSDTDCSTNLNFICQYRPLSCGKPEKPTNSTLLTKNIDNGTVIEYQCAPGNLLMGPKSRACLPTGFFSEFAPKCKYLDCQFPAMIPNGDYKLLNGTTSYQSIVNYFCQDGFQLYGKASLTCDVDERWNGPPPRCEPLLCPAPVPPSNGYVTVNSNITIPGTQAKYDCRPGYELVGDHLLTCSQSGSWDNSFPYCRERRTTLPPHAVHVPASTATSTTTPPPAGARVWPQTGRLATGGVQFPQSGVTRSTTAAPQQTAPASTAASTSTTTSSTTSTTSLPVSLNGLASQFSTQSSQAPPAPPTPVAPPPSPTQLGEPAETGDAPNRKAAQSAPPATVFEVPQPSPQPAAPASSVQPPARARPATSTAASPTQTFTLHTGATGNRQQSHLASASNKFPQISAQQPTQATSFEPTPASSSSVASSASTGGSSSTTTSASTSQLPHLQHHHHQSTGGPIVGAPHNVLASFGAPGRSAHSSLASAKYSLDGIIAVAIFGGFIFLGAIITIIVIIIRRKSSHSSSIDAQTISTYDSNSGEHNGLYRNYQQAWENLRYATPSGQPKSSGGGGGDGGLMGASAVGLKNFAAPAGVAVLHPHHAHHHLHHPLHKQAGGHHNLAMTGTGSTSSSQSSVLGGGGDPLLRGRHAHQPQRVSMQQQRLSMHADSDELDADEQGVLSADETSYHEQREAGEGFRDSNELTINADTVFNRPSQTAARRRLYSGSSIGRANRLSGNLSIAGAENAHLHHHHGHHAHHVHHAGSSSGSSQHRRLVSSSTPSTSTRSSRASPPSDGHSLEQLAYGNNWHQGAGGHPMGSQQHADSSSNNNSAGSGASILGGAGRANQLRYN